MKLLKISQQESRETWLEARIGKITGTKAGKIRPLSRGADRTPVGFWELLAEKLAIAPDGEPVMDRGVRLENQALELTAQKYELELDFDPGFWLSDFSDEIASSPDAAEPGDKPTYAAEAKCLSSANHLKYVIKDKWAQKKPDYNSFEQIPREYHDQVLQYFVVNEHLKTLYFTLYDDRVAVEELAHHVIKVERKNIKEQAEELRDIEIQMLSAVNDIVKEFI